jgi:hypothetical protein
LIVVEVSIVARVELNTPVAIGLGGGALLLALALGAIASRTAGALWLAVSGFVEVGLFTGALAVGHTMSARDQSRV